MPDDHSKQWGAIDSFIRNQTPYLQGSIVHADQKATFLLAIIVAFLGYLEDKQSLAARMSALREWGGWESLSAAVSLTAACLLIISGYFAGCVVHPRYSRKAAKGSASFIEICRAFPDPDKFAHDALRCTEKELAVRQLRLHQYRSCICSKKWRRLNAAYWLSLAGFALFALSFILAVLHEVKSLP